MFLNSWSLVLSLSSIIVLLMVFTACRTSVRVLRYWNPASDSNLQISLESETWLASTLVAYALGFQIITLILFVLAADNFCQVIAGAMCATGALLANSFGMPALFVKITGIFLYGFWIVLHKLDVSSETYPLVRHKHIFLLVLLPLLLAEVTLQTLYIANLSPDIITSCCAVVFSTASGNSKNMLGSFDQTTMLFLFYGSIAVISAMGIWLMKKWHAVAGYAFAAFWVWFFLFSMVAITTVFSSYIYAMPYHHCPFCILKPEYNYIGFALYGTLLPAAFFGISSACVTFLNNKESLKATIHRYQTFSIRFSLILLLIFAVLSSYHLLLYKISGGEI